MVSTLFLIHDKLGTHKKSCWFLFFF
jgi:hypothetical protein